MSRPMPRLVAATLLVALVVTAAWLVLGVTTQVAFADLIKPILEAKSARFKATIEVEGQAPQSAKVMVLEPGRVRQELPMGMVSICDFNKRKMVMLIPALKKAFVTEFANMSEDKVPINYFDQLRTGLLEAREKPYAKREDLGEKEIGRRRAVGYRITAPTRATTLWSDPDTGLPIQAELTMAMAPNVKVTMTDFVFQVDLDESLFSVEPPAGYSVISTPPVDTSPPSEKDLIGTFRRWSNLADGAFPDSLTMQALIRFLLKYKYSPVKKRGKPTDEQLKGLMQFSMQIGRGFQFAHELPPEANAHYAGRGVTCDTPDRPIFWYRPEGKKTYRVIYADLSVREAETPPKVSNAQPVPPKPAAEK